MSGVRTCTCYARNRGSAECDLTHVQKPRRRLEHYATAFPALRIEGNTGDTIRLENEVAGHALSGGIWVAGITSYANGEAWTHYDYVFNDVVRASVSIDTDIDVQFV
jgi:hypothetical protein